jgi:hypothetical protein
LAWLLSVPRSFSSLTPSTIRSQWRELHRFSFPLSNLHVMQRSIPGIAWSSCLGVFFSYTSPHGQCTTEIRTHLHGHPAFIFHLPWRLAPDRPFLGYCDDFSKVASHQLHNSLWKHLRKKNFDGGSLRQLQQTTTYRHTVEPNSRIQT